jgi:hypothetical protein
MQILYANFYFLKNKESRLKKIEELSPSIDNE